MRTKESNALACFVLVIRGCKQFQPQFNSTQFPSSLHPTFPS